MSARVIEAVNKMITHADHITGVIRNGGEYIFCYMNKHVWGVSKSREPSSYFLFYYPKRNSTEELAIVTNWNEINYVRYSSKEIGTPEAQSSMAELLTIAQEKLHGVDEVLDEIISG